MFKLLKWNLLRKKLKLLIAYGSKGKYFHLKEFCEALAKLGVECRLVKDIDYVRGFPSKNIRDWFPNQKKFKNLIHEFKPDIVFVDRQTHFGLAAIKANLPLFILLRGHYWSELEWGKKTLYGDPKTRLIIWFRNRVIEKCFRESTAILPICSYLQTIVKQRYPTKHTHVFFEGINYSHWYKVSNMKLMHPCVGLLQDANWWGKTKELLVLKHVLKEMPEVSFYWAGDGPYRKKIIDELNQFNNFHWLGRLQYPDKVREYLSEIDVYALVSGMDLAPLTLKEAQLMEKPVVATNAGGISEMMRDQLSGFLIKEGDPIDLAKKISVLLKDKELARKMGVAGRKFVQETFDWEIIAKNFFSIMKSYCNG